MPLLAPPPSALNSAVPFTRPPSLPLSVPNSGVLLGGLSALGLLIGAVDAIGELGANKWRDDLLGKTAGNKSTPSRTAPKPNDLADLPDTPNGYEIRRNDGVWLRNGTRGFTAEEIKNITRFYANDEEAIAAGNVTASGVLISYFNAVRPIGNDEPLSFGGVTSPNGLPLTNEPRTSEGLDPRNKQLLPPNLSSAIGWGNTGNIDGRAALGIGSPLTGNPKLDAVPSALGVGNPSTIKPPSPTKREQDQQNDDEKSEQQKRREEQEKRDKAAEDLLKGLRADNASILQELIKIGSISALINSNTQPDAQRLNAKNGACDALNSPSCTKGMEDRIKDPINEKVDSVATKATAIASGLDLLKNLTENSFKFISRIYNNQFVHSSLSFMTTMTTIHNAAMLSRDVAETLGTVVDNSVNLSGQKLKDADGNDISFTSWIGTNIRALIVQLIGADKYVQLALQWQKANTIYHSAMAVVNTTQSMLDPLSSAVEYGMENVSKIGNGLREDGVVSENSYPAMDETIRARRVNRFERLNDTLEGAENISSNLSSITGSAVSVKEDFNQLREDRKQLRDQAARFNANDEQERAALKASLPTQITPLNLTPAPEEEETL